MVLAAVLLDLVALTVAFGARSWVQRRRTGDWGWRVGRPHSAAEAVARSLLVASLVLIVVALATVADPPPVAVGAIAVLGAVASIALVAVSQLQMADSWRIGIDPDERTELVRTGVYARIRNPIYTGMAGFAVAHVGMTPSVWAALAAVAMTVGVQIQVRCVEEPYLARVHGEDYRTWAGSSGRFVPGLG